VILLGVDSLRADHFDKPQGLRRMPRILKLRDESVEFTMCRSPGARTITTWSSVFAGRYVSGLKWAGEGNRLNISADKQKRFSDFLREGGVETATWVSYAALGKSGLAKNFSFVKQMKYREGQNFGISEDVVAEMIEYILKPAKGPRFIFAHWMDPHFPYDLVQNKKAKAFDRHLGEVKLVDDSFGKLWDALDGAGLLDRTVIFFTADHGEGFGEHDTPYHTVNVYEEIIRVPLFIRIPGVAPRKVTTPVTLMDLGPTFLDLFGMPAPATHLGQSLMPFVRGQSPKLTRPIGAERHGTRALIIGKYKVIDDYQRGREEIYDLEKDPDEAHNLADEMGPEGAHLLGLVRHFFDAHALPGGPGPG
jgi:arylsulfatase A-like enzyme